MTQPSGKPAAVRTEAASDHRADVNRVLSPAAQRALAEAAERRAARERETAKVAPELGGREGPDPVRYGDWENKGIVSDF